MVSALFPIGVSVMHALVLSGTNIFFSKFADHGEKERKRHDLTLEKFQRAGDKWIEDRIKQPHFTNKGCVKRMKQKHTSTQF